MADRTLVLLKPDAVRRGLVGEIISRFERKGLRLVAMSKVPFANLGDPLVRARVDAEARATPPRDGFGDYYVPLSALTFRQGFGRLVRM